MTEIAGEPIGTLLLFVVIIAVTVVLARLVYVITRRFLDGRVSGRSSRTIARVLEYTVLVWGLYLGLVNVLRLDLATFAASLGIITLAIAFSAQQIVSNSIAGVLIALERPFHVDDWVQIGSSGLCRVREIGLTNTRLLGSDGTMVTVPNSSVLTSTVVNFSRSCYLQVAVNIEVPATADVNRVGGRIARILETNPDVLTMAPEGERSVFNKLLVTPGGQAITECDGDSRRYEPTMLITKVTPSTVGIEVRLWIQNVEDRDRIRSEVLAALLAELRSMEARPMTEAAPKPDPILEAVRDIAEELRRMRERGELEGGQDTGVTERLPMSGRRQ